MTAGRDAWAAYQRWLDGYGARCRRCGLPVFWHTRPKFPYWCIVTAPAPPADLETEQDVAVGGPIARYTGP